MICSDPRSGVELAAQLGVSKNTIHGIRSGRNWSLVTGRRDPRLPPPRVRSRAGDRQCTVPDCERPQKTCGLCDLHYGRSRRECGTPITEKKRRVMGKGHAFLLKALAHESDDCLLWPYGKIKGYGAAGVCGSNVKTHVWVCEQYRGPKPFPEAHAAHRCGNTACVNKHHIRWATPLENIRDKALHGRQTRGEAINTAVLTEEQVKKIAHDGRPFPEIAREYGCTRSTVRSIQAGESWRAVTGIDPAKHKPRQKRWNFSREQVEEIKSDPRSCKQMARAIGCSSTTINEIRRGLRAA